MDKMHTGERSPENDPIEDPQSEKPTHHIIRDGEVIGRVVQTTHGPMSSGDRPAQWVRWNVQERSIAEAVYQSDFIRGDKKSESFTAKKQAKGFAEGWFTAKYSDCELVKVTSDGEPVHPE